jgi:ATP-dependent Clp protease ATP-binding subunit ClpX
MGFGADIQSRKERNIGAILEMVQPEDLLKFGLIPEFVGRLPVIATLGELDEAALVQILTEPKNALVKQFQRLLEFENVTLRFTDSGLQAIARRSLERKSGARGLRAIMEATMLDIMYEIPSMSGVKECVINEDVILDNEEPILLFEQSQDRALSQ